MSDPSGQLGTGSETAPLPILVAASLCIVGALSGWFVHARLEDLSAPIEGLAGGAAHRVRPDVFLVTLGNVRADHLPTWRYDRSTMPWLNDVARRSHVFLNASATSSWSLPSVASLMTGLLPSQHGLEALPRETGTSFAVDAIPDEVATLAETFAGAGYDTWAVVSNPTFLEETGLARGFGSYTNLGFVRSARLRFAVERIANAVDKSPRPAFVWVHYSEAHAPYGASSPMVNVWEDLPEEGEDATPPPTEGRARDEQRRAAAAREHVGRYGRMGVPELLGLPELAADGPALHALRTLYDGELRTMDDQLQLLYGDLGVSDDDVVIVAGDHGEEFRDHGGLGHGATLYEEVVRVPLVVSWPAVWKTPRRHRERVSLVDLVPTLTALAGARPDDAAIPDARSLLPLLDGEPWTRDAPVVAELLRADGVRCRALYDDDHKLVAGAAGEVELYALDPDPGERTDLAATKPDKARELLAELERAVPREGVTNAVDAQPAPQLVQQLRALGYEAPPATECP